MTAADVFLLAACGLYAVLAVWWVWFAVKHREVR